MENNRWRREEEEEEEEEPGTNTPSLYQHNTDWPEERPVVMVTADILDTCLVVLTGLLNNNNNNNNNNSCYKSKIINGLIWIIIFFLGIIIMKIWLNNAFELDKYRLFTPARVERESKLSLSPCSRRK